MVERRSFPLIEEIVDYTIQRYEEKSREYEAEIKKKRREKIKKILKISAAVVGAGSIIAGGVFSYYGYYSYKASQGAEELAKEAGRIIGNALKGSPAYLEKTKNKHSN